MAKSEPEKTKAVFDPKKRVAQFVRDHVIVRLQRIGFSSGKAKEMANAISDEEILSKDKTIKMTGLGDGTILKWLSSHQTQLLGIVENIFNLLALFSSPPASAVKTKSLEDQLNEASQPEEDEEAEDEDAAEEDADAEEEPEEPPVKKKKR